MSGVPDQTQAKQQRTMERLGSKWRNEKNDPDQGTAAVPEGFVQDQIILAPEIMSLILEHLDVGDLKRVRLVCKSWFLEAQSHMKRMGIVWLGKVPGMSSQRIREFLKVIENKTPALPQPFLSLDVSLSHWGRHQRLLSNLLPPLVITRLSPANLDLRTTLELVIQSSSSLEYLKLSSLDSDDFEEDPTNSRQKQDVQFPKLRHLAVDASPGSVDDYHEYRESLPSTVAWIMEASLNVTVFEISGRWTGRGYEENPEVKTANQVLRQVDISKVRTLKLKELNMDNATLKHMASLPFSNLQNLRIENVTPGVAGAELLLAIVTKATTTLKMLELCDQELLLGAETRFPICPNVRELYLVLQHGFWHEFVSGCFPSLQEFCICLARRYLYIGQMQKVFHQTPIYGEVKTLRLVHTKYSPGWFSPMELFKTFPALERLRIRQSVLFEYWRMKTSSGDPHCVDLLGGLKHLEVQGSLREWFDPVGGSGPSLFAELKGIVILAVHTTLSEVAKLPIQEMPSLKILRIPWGDFQGLRMKKLLKIAKQVEKIVVTNCCSVLREKRSRSKVLLKRFFDAAPNAACGCKEQGIMELPW